jgi:hypothetical protein
MEDLGFIIFAIIFGYVFFGPHTKKKEEKKDDKGEKK